MPRAHHYIQILPCRFKKKNMHKQRFTRGGLAAWSVYHPIGVIMIALAVVVLGLFSLYTLGIDLDGRSNHATT
ncbi:hypothetical protein THIOM_003947 [Candidatus Thiomargarita nelsonii]|uniref:Uncharacterized protein n=1 Tax=Candidatus Thiomargarita nelsonii TaxID=1003181 RepID=A0A176RXD1_9GAMM|nr:hypothetical protein THIOM_003947 [Candidatus Thiomargarita nelsonii]